MINNLVLAAIFIPASPSGLVLVPSHQQIRPGPQLRRAIHTSASDAPLWGPPADNSFLNGKLQRSASFVGGIGSCARGAVE
jgi:hypothetical protein